MSSETRRSTPQPAAIVGGGVYKIVYIGWNRAMPQRGRGACASAGIPRG